jgi:hypothetical protein
MISTYLDVDYIISTIKVVPAKVFQHLQLHLSLQPDEEDN